MHGSALELAHRAGEEPIRLRADGDARVVEQVEDDGLDETLAAATVVGDWRDETVHIRRGGEPAQDGRGARDVRTADGDGNRAGELTGWIQGFSHRVAAQRGGVAKTARPSVLGSAAATTKG